MATEELETAPTPDIPPTDEEKTEVHQKFANTEQMDTLTFKKW